MVIIPFYADLLAGRALHAFEVSQEAEDYRFRVSGMVLTFGAIVQRALFVLSNFFIS